MVNVGLVTFAVTPSARQAPRTNVVLPAPSSPLTSTTSPGPRSAASRAPAASVCSGELLEQAQLLDIGRGFCLLDGLGEQGWKLVQVFAQLLLDGIGPQRRGWMEQREKLDGAAGHLAFLRAPVHLGDAGRVAGEELGREVPERADDLRLDQLDLAIQVGLAGLDLLGQRVPVAGRPAADDVGDEDLRALDPDLQEQLIQELPGASDERQALLILLSSGGLANEH